MKNNAYENAILLRDKIKNEISNLDLFIKMFNELSPKDIELNKNPAAVALGRLGGIKGGKARADKLTPQRRSEIAKKAADARWKND